MSNFIEGESGLEQSKQRNKHQSTGNISVFLIGILLIIAIFLSFFMDDYVIDVIQHIQNQSINPIFGFLGSIETILMILALIPSIYLFNKHKNKAILCLWGGLASSVIIPFIIKFVTMRERPVGSYNPWGDLSSSFPSMHSAIAFTSAFIASHYLPKFRFFFFTYAVLVAFTRIYFGFHYFSDIVTGSILGIGIGWVLMIVGNNKTE